MRRAKVGERGDLLAYICAVLLLFAPQLAPAEPPSPQPITSSSSSAGARTARKVAQPMKGAAASSASSIASAHSKILTAPSEPVAKTATSSVSAQASSSSSEVSQASPTPVPPLVVQPAPVSVPKEAALKDKTSNSGPLIFLAVIIGTPTAIFLFFKYRITKLRRERAEAEGSFNRRIADLEKEREAWSEERSTLKSELESLSKWKSVKDTETAIRRLREDLEREQEEQEKKVATAKEELRKVASDYSDAKNVYDKLKKEISLLQEDLEDISIGIYKPHFSFETSEQYKSRLTEARAERKTLVKNRGAVHCAKSWTVGGSSKEGEKMVKQYSKLLLRAFNGESDAAIANVDWNNITKMEQRVTKAYEAINELGSTMEISITPKYLKVCLDELRLTHEMQEKKYKEQEEQRQIRERMRDEEKAQRELERAQKEAETDERRYAAALEKAQAKLAEANAEETDELKKKIEALEQQLATAQEEKARAQSRAELTRSGYVYVISNVGSFGENVYKIGMTRRLDPMERIRELGDASVPFSFDVHALVYSDDAPALECALHQHLEEKRMNRINPRKEFFEVSLDEIEKIAKNTGLKVEFAKVAAAREYRESVADRVTEERKPPKKPSEFPAELGMGAA